MKNKNIEIDKVLKNDFCVGCGSCVLNEKKNFMKFNKIGQYIPIISKKNDLIKNDKFCPFSKNSLNENKISRKIFNIKKMQYNQNLGNFYSVYVGYDKSKINFRKNGSSGGLTSWIINELMSKRLIDAFISVGWCNKKKIFEYKIFKNINDVKKSSKTRYYPVEFSNVLKKIDPLKKYAFVGIPCYIKALRNHSFDNPIIKNSIKYYISILCGHQKNKFYFDNILQSLNTSKKKIIDFDFRKKILGKPANKYGIYLEQKNKNITTPATNIFGADWGLNFFKYKACDFCDDVAGETADISFGDAWLKNEVRDYRGHNIIITRNKKLNEILNLGYLNNEIFLRKSNPKELYDSQQSSFRHRREGLQVRINNLKTSGYWYPKKRLFKNLKKINNNKIKVYNQRIILQNLSNTLYKKKYFYLKMIFQVTIYYFYSKKLIKFLIKEFLRFFQIRLIF